MDGVEGRSGWLSSLLRFHKGPRGVGANFIQQVKYRIDATQMESERRSMTAPRTHGANRRNSEYDDDGR